MISFRLNGAIIALLLLVIGFAAHNSAAQTQDGELLVYDPLIQSGFYADSAFGSRLKSGCLAGADTETDETGFMGGGLCVWGSAGARYTRHNTSLEYDEDAYSFTGGVSAPFSFAEIDFGISYESSNFDSEAVGQADKAGLTTDRFIAGIQGTRYILNTMDADMRIQIAQTEMDTRRASGSDSYTASPDLRTVSIAGGVEKPVLAGDFVLVPRFEIGMAYLSVDAFSEEAEGSSDADNAITFEDTSEFLIYLNPSLGIEYPVTDFMNLFGKAGAQILSTYYPETRWKGAAAGGDSLRANGTIERVMYDYGLGMNFVADEGGRVNLRFEYDGSASSSFETFVHGFRGRVNVAF